MKFMRLHNSEGFYSHHIFALEMLTTRPTTAHFARAFQGNIEGEKIDNSRVAVHSFSVASVPTCRAGQ